MKPPTSAKPWNAFTSPMLERYTLYGAGGRCVLARADRPVMSMDEDEVRQLIDSLQKYLAVTE